LDYVKYQLTFTPRSVLGSNGLELILPHDYLCQMLLSLPMASLLHIKFAKLTKIYFTLVYLVQLTLGKKIFLPSFWF